MQAAYQYNILPVKMFWDTYESVTEQPAELI